LDAISADLRPKILKTLGAAAGLRIVLTSRVAERPAEFADLVRPLLAQVKA